MTWIVTHPITMVIKNSYMQQLLTYRCALVASCNKSHPTFSSTLQISFNFRNAGTTHSSQQSWLECAVPNADLIPSMFANITKYLFALIKLLT